MLVGLALVLLSAWVAAVTVAVRALRARRARPLAADRARFAAWRPGAPVVRRRPYAAARVLHHRRRPAPLDAPRPLADVAPISAGARGGVQRPLRRSVQRRDVAPNPAHPRRRVQRPGTCGARPAVVPPRGLVALLGRPVVEMALLLAGLVTWILAVTHAGPSSPTRAVVLLVGVVGVYVIDAVARADRSQSQTGQPSADA